MSNLLAIRETTGGKRSVYNNCDILSKHINILFISEVGTGSSSHDFDGDFMMSSLISITQVGSNIESLQCGSLCGCVCDRMVDAGGKERRMFSMFVTKKFENAFARS